MVSDLDLGWLAGLIDGEGCLTVQWINRRNKSGGNVSAEVRIEATSLPMMEKATRILTACNVHNSVVIAPARKNSTKVIYRLTVYRAAEVVRLLSLLKPLLAVKGAEADMILSWYKRWPDQRGRASVDRATFDEKMAFRKAVSQLKLVA